ncbi:hypothetical protein [Salinimonas chungwhensis]|uniref:hypothetical protein n=1 Tax=Salinimonas chungwhensis TaxID=265425 RepID=UPI0003769487|nr:hypothetical protein [Salinimonas chungwhensis]
MFLSKELKTVQQAHLNYTQIKLDAHQATEDAKYKSRLVMAKPSVLLSIFGYGAFKGATTSDPKSKRRFALMSFARTAFFNFIG